MPFTAIGTTRSGRSALAAYKSLIIFHCLSLGQAGVNGALGGVNGAQQQSGVGELWWKRRGHERGIAMRRRDHATGAGGAEGPMEAIEVNLKWAMMN